MARAYAAAPLAMADHVKIIEPLGYFDTLMLLRHAKMVFSDSGGMQKEAYWARVPCVTLREETEWVGDCGCGLECPLS